MSGIIGLNASNKTHTTGGFTSPSSIPGLQYWYDPSDAATVTLSGSNITQLLDKSGGSHTCTPGTNYPTILVGDCHGVNTIYFNGFYFDIASPISFPSSAWTIIGITWISAGMNNYFGSSSPTTTFLVERYNDQHWYLYNGTRWWSSSATWSDTLNYHQICAIWDGANYFLYIDNSSIALTSGSLLSATGNINRFGFGDSVSSGACGEFTLYNQAISGTDRNSMYTYLKTKWGTP